MPRERIIEIKLNREWTKANAYALVRARSAVETELFSRILAKYNIRKTELKKRIDVTLSHQDSAVYIKMKKGAVSIRLFNPKLKISIRKGKATQKGFTVNILKGKRQWVKKGFLVNFKVGINDLNLSSYRHRVESAAGKTRTVKGKREMQFYGVKSYYGPTIYKIVKSSRFMEQIFTMFKLRYEEKLAHELIRRGF